MIPHLRAGGPSAKGDDYDVLQYIRGGHEVENLAALLS